MNIGDSVLIGLLIKGESQAWLARKMGVTPQYVSAICTNQKSMRAPQMQLIASILGVRVSTFIRWGEVMCELRIDDVKKFSKKDILDAIKKDAI